MKIAPSQRRVRSREVVKQALARNSTAVIMVHSHPVSPIWLTLRDVQLERQARYSQTYPQSRRDLG
ncbi:MAG: JAB domain-containing protein [Steroidobacteraceae bacterium]